MVTQGYTATLVAATLAISRSSLYYRKRLRSSRADRTYDEQIVVACGEKPAYGYRRVAWWLRRKEGLTVNRKRVLRVMRERSLLVGSRRLRARRKKQWGRVEAAEPNQIWQSDMTKIWAGPAVGWAYLVSVIDCCTREIVGWTLDRRCRAGEWIAAVRTALESRGLMDKDACRKAGLVLRSDNGSQPCSKTFVEFLASRGVRGQYTGYDAPDDNAYVERVIRTIKEEEIWPNLYDTLAEARTAVATYVEYYNTERVHSALNYRTPSEIAAALITRNAA